MDPTGRWLTMPSGSCQTQGVRVPLDPHELYEVTGEPPDAERPVLIHALTGFVDAGSAAQLARQHLLSTLDAREVVRFDVDRLLDYRSRRPAMTFVEDHWENYDEPVLALYEVRDA